MHRQIRQNGVVKHAIVEEARLLFGGIIMPRALTRKRNPFILHTSPMARSKIFCLASAIP